MAANEDTLRADLEAAIASAEEEAVPERESGEPQAPEEALAEPAVSAELPTEPEGGDQPAAAPEPEEAKEEGPSKAPGGWSPTARETWADLPEVAKVEIAKRERETAQALNDTAEARKFHQAFEERLGQYRPLVQAHGGSDMVDAADRLFQTAAVLQGGSAQAKAERIAQLINFYGVDINTLDDVLTHQVKGTQSPQSQLDAYLDQKLAPVNQMLQSITGRVQETQVQTEREAARSIEDFSATAEFMDDVRLDMGDLLQLAADRGRAMTLQEAYDIACDAHPEIGPIVRQRRAAAVSGPSKRDAAASLKSAGTQTPPPGTRPTDGSVRDDLMAAIEQLEANGRGRI